MVSTSSSDLGQFAFWWKISGSLKNPPLFCILPFPFVYVFCTSCYILPDLQFAIHVMCLCVCYHILQNVFYIMQFQCMTFNVTFLPSRKIVSFHNILFKISFLIFSHIFEYIWMYIIPPVTCLWKNVWTVIFIFNFNSFGDFGFCLWTSVKHILMIIQCSMNIHNVFLCFLINSLTL